MKTFEEMIATEEGQRELDQVIHETPGLEVKHAKIMNLSNNLEHDVYKAIETIFAFGDMTGCDALSDNEQSAHKAVLMEFKTRVINEDMLCKFIDMVCTPLRYEAYKILCEREKGDDSA